ncbi:hypothetical protein V8E53_003337 [Lactarius tabidus]
MSWGSDQSRPPDPPRAFPEPNVPSEGYMSTYKYTPTRQPQAPRAYIGDSRLGLAPPTPRQFPLQPAYPGEYTSTVPRAFDPIPDHFICAMDFDHRMNPPTGLIISDTMYDVMVKPLPRGCRLTAVLDCCNSGNLLDLPYSYDSNGVGVVKPTRPDIIQRKASDAVVISVGACKDNGRAYETRNGGALREAFITHMKRSGNGGTYLQAIQGLPAFMAENDIAQRPQLSSSHLIDTNQRFMITE